MVDAVVFDVGRVLYQWDLRHLYAKLIDDSQELDWFLASVVTEAWHFEHDAGRPLAEMVAERSAQFPEHAHLIEAYANRFEETIPGPVPGSLEIVKALAKRGTPLYAITNFAAPFWQVFRTSRPIFKHFLDVVVSGVEKVAKPEAAIFRLAQARFGHAPEAMLFIDDSRENVEAARSEGWQVHHFIDAVGLEADLRGRGLI